MLFCKYTIECSSNFIMFYLKNRPYILLKQKREILTIYSSLL